MSYTTPKQRRERGERILEYLQQYGPQKEFQISEFMGYSMTTVRRDLSVLFRHNRVCIKFSGHGFRRWSAV